MPKVEIIELPTDEPAIERRMDISQARRGIGLVVAMLLMVLGLQFAVGNLQPFKIVSRSMDPTLQVGDHVLILRNHATDDLDEKIIAFEPDDSGSALTKRVLAQEGERVDLKQGQLYVDGQQDRHGREPLRISRTRTWRLGKNQVFVAGDNRNNSYDSVDHGPISRSRVIGVLALRYWPPERIGVVN